jgi:C-terminal processing protease CtpA/Prc
LEKKYKNLLISTGVLTLLTTCAVVLNFSFKNLHKELIQLAFNRTQKTDKKIFDPNKDTESNTENNSLDTVYSEFSHCNLNRENFQSLLPDNLKTATVLNPKQQHNHLDETVRVIRDNNIWAEKIFSDQKFLDKIMEIENKIDQGLETSEYYLEIKRLFALIGDNHSTFLTPEETEQYDSLYTGPRSSLSAGVSLVSCVNPWEETGAALITYVYEDSPAQKAGLKPFQLITEINGEPAVAEGKLNLNSTKEEVREYTVLNYEGKKESYKIELAQVTPNHVFYEDHGTYHYFNIKSFTTTNINKFNSLYSQNASQDNKPLVLDLRFNTGGDVYALEKMLNNFFETGTKVGHTESSIYSDEELIVGKSSPIQNRNVYIWTWYLTDSSAQIFTGIMQEEGKVKAIGIDLDGNVESISAVSIYIDNSKAINSIKMFHPTSGNNWSVQGIPTDYNIGDVVWGTFPQADDPYKTKTLDVIKNIK